ncbi:GH3 auxin-responsive promoter family protein [Flagellimonas myxillae]|uniref:GH3 auxin-responsive promoter family protein n=1 Tax=Flagellimonas myxillae TaxID=2942214 RepID=UPI00201F4AF1|nr:GH3 auxin-responsive promoter family protein [Muricauda myxillae]MCL6266655.1 GH3 auxin-responsive promoter family protein [Muricauda myxillae]
MSLKSVAAKLFAKRIAQKTREWSSNPVKSQQKVFQDLITSARNTEFGKDHDFENITSYADFVAQVPIRDYEELKGYIQKIMDGANDVLWPSKPKYFAKTSGTTSGAKYIPITKESIKNQVAASRNAILNYIYETGNADFVDGSMIFLQGSPELDEKGGIKLGRLSGISAHYVPNYLQRNRLPSWETNCIEDWETKVDKIVEETENENMTVIAGIPSWVQMYFEKLNTKSGKKVGELFKNFQLFIYGGVNYEPYRAKFEELLGRKVDSIELFPASEGFFAYQDSQQAEGMLLLLDAGIFYEFIRTDEFFQKNPKRLTIEDVVEGVDYAMIISTNAGLWAYNLGDTVRFVSTKPYRVVVSGRVKHFISAFGEHVIAKEVEEAIQIAMSKSDAVINEFTVAPQTSPPEGELPYHEWFIEFETPPSDFTSFIADVEESMKTQNSYYLDLIAGNILQPLKISQVKSGGFQEYMKTIGKLGGQNKVQRLSNDRKVAKGLQPFLI